MGCYSHMAYIFYGEEHFHEIRVNGCYGVMLWMIIVKLLS